MNNLNKVVSMLILVSLTEVKTAKDGRSFYTASFRDALNPFAKTTSRNFWQQFNSAGESVWKGADPKDVKPFLGKQIPGSIVTLEVQPYEIVDQKTQEARVANTYTAVVMGNELTNVVFKSLGHEVLQAEAVAAAEVPAEQLEIA